MGLNPQNEGLRIAAIDAVVVVDVVGDQRGGRMDGNFGSERGE